MPNLKVSDAELKTILKELETDLSKYLSDTQGEKLSKAREEDGSPSPGFGGASPSAEGGSPSASVAPSAEGGATPDASPMGAGDGDGDEGALPPEEGAGDMPPEEGAAPEGDPAAEQGVDPQALEAEYAQLPIEELKAHYLAAKSALFQMMGQQGGAPGGAPPGAPQGAPPPAGPPAPAAGPSAAPAGPDMGGAPPMGAGPSAGAPPMGAGGPPQEEAPPPALKAEMPSDGNGKIEGFGKSEVTDLRAQLAAMAKVVNLLAGQPVQKAVTGLTYMGKGEPVEEKVVLSRQEITAKLNTLTRDPSLKKSDRERITGYYDGTVNVSAIADLLK